MPYRLGGKIDGQVISQVGTLLPFLFQTPITYCHTDLCIAKSPSDSSKLSNLIPKWYAGATRSSNNWWNISDLVTMMASYSEVRGNEISINVSNKFQRTIIGRFNLMTALKLLPVLRSQNTVGCQIRIQNGPNGAAGSSNNCLLSL